MAEKFSIYAGEPMATALAGYDDSRSGRINQVCADWLLMVRDQAPELTESEWCAVADALNGLYMRDSDEATYRFAWAEIADAPELGPKWGIDQPALAAKLRALGTSQLVALAEIVRRFWADPNAAAPAELLRLAGARFSDPAETPSADTPEADAAWFARARPAAEVLAELPAKPADKA